MKVWVYVEGQSDVRALDALWGEWKLRLNDSGWGIKTIPLKNKHEYLRKIGSRATEKLTNDSSDLVVGLPDLYPNRGLPTEYGHGGLSELKDLQTRLVGRNLQSVVSKTDLDSCIARFYAGAFKHDMEVLLLAATSQLQSRLRMAKNPRGWRRPPEQQNQNKPPKRVVEELFRTSLKRRYNDITDSSAILKCANLHDVAAQCPTFRALIDWIGEKTGVRAC